MPLVVTLDNLLVKSGLSPSAKQECCVCGLPARRFDKRCRPKRRLYRLTRDGSEAIYSVTIACIASYQDL